jgi:beta-glucosidase
MKTSPIVRSLLEQLTLEEKVALLAGASIWYTVPVERLGIGALKVTDGPNGARGDGLFTSGTPTACLPVGIALAATWNTELVRQVGQLLGEESLAKGARVLLGPTVNIHRSTLNGRNFECYSEDPYLAARMAVAYINGLQSQGVGASVKHFAGNNSEFERNTISSEIGERALREIYLPAFEAAVKEAGAWTVMAAYNKVNGTFACEHPELLTKILKEEWGFEGVVISDWFGTHSTAAALNAGLDLEMPGPTRWRGARLVQAVEDGEVSEADITAAAERILHLLERAEALLPGAESRAAKEEEVLNLPEHRAIARRAASESIVLLKNQGDLLPLDPNALRRVAIIGPNARTAQIMGGGSAQVNAYYAVTPFDGIAAQLGSGVELGYETGCTNHKYLPLIPLGQTAQATYYNSLDLSGEPLWQSALASSDVIWLGDIGPGVDPASFSVRIEGSFTPEVTGDYQLGLMSSGLSRLYLNGEEIIDNWSAQRRGDAYFGTGSTEKLAVVTLTGGEPVDLTIEYSRQSAGVIPGVRLGGMPVAPEDSIARAASLAGESDVALVFVGSNSDWESEGADRHDMDLVGRQAELIEAVAAANPRTVVVVQTGSPVVMPWLDAPAAVLQAWFPGQECGNAIADVLFGKVDATGRLPQTFPQRLQDNPAYINYPGENGKVTYGEGIFVGYRYYDKKEVKPLFPFGFGLSYTDFEYDNLRLSSDSVTPDDSLGVTVDIRNTGASAGTEVVQLYVRDDESAVLRPPKELKGFAKVALKPGETRTVSFDLDRRALAYWDDLEHSWTAEAGEFQVLVGRSAEDIRLTASFTLDGSARFDGPGRKAEPLNLDSTIKALMANERARAVIDRRLPGFSSNPQIGFAQGFSLAQLAAFDPDSLNETVLRAIQADLSDLAVEDSK